MTSSTESFADQTSAYLAVRYTLAATFVLYFYEYLCTLDEEVRLVWPTIISLVKLIFFINRYLPFSYIIVGCYMYILNTDESGQRCRNFLNVQGLLSAIGIIFAESILALRVYVIWDKSKRIGILLLVLLLVGGIGGLTETAHFLKTASVSETRIFTTGCSVKYAIRSSELLSYGLIALYEVFVLSLMLFKLYGVRKSSTALIRIAYGDSVVYCISVLSFTIINVIILKTGSEIICHLLLLPQAAMHNVLCNRLLLRLRSANTALTEDGFLSIHLPPETTELSMTPPTFRAPDPESEVELRDESTKMVCPGKNTGENGESGPSRRPEQPQSRE